MKETFKILKTKYNSSKYLGTDPISIVHRYKSSKDIEISSLIVALYSYGNVKSILKFMDRLLFLMGTSPYEFLLTHDNPKKYFRGKLGAYRFQKEEDHIEFMLSLGSLIRIQNKKNKGGIDPIFEEIFLTNDGKKLSIDELKDGFGILSFQKSIRREIRNESSGLNFLVGIEKLNSPNKRYSMFLRWMTGTEYPDFGLYKNYPLDSLVFPLDTHITNIMDILDMTSLQSPSRKKVIVFTDELSRILGEPAILYDFALSRLGIFEKCKKKYQATTCPDCELRKHCKYFT